MEINLKTAIKGYVPYIQKVGFTSSRIKIKFYIMYHVILKINKSIVNKKTYLSNLYFYFTV